MRDRGIPALQDGEEVKHTRHYCPKHIHAKCAQCGRREILDRRTLENIGWEELNDMECTLCPDCANKGNV